MDYGVTSGMTYNYPYLTIKLNISPIRGFSLIYIMYNVCIDIFIEAM